MKVLACPAPLGTTVLPRGSMHPQECAIRAVTANQARYWLNPLKFSVLEKGSYYVTNMLETGNFSGGYYNTGNSLCNGSYTTGCDPGSYCSTDMLDTVTGNCSAGYYRTGNFTTDQPTGTGVTSYLSLQVTDAPQATSVFPTEPCDPGTFLLSQGATVNSFCLSCTAGKYCSQSGLSAIEGDCSQGMTSC
ncbi:hypothetical protein MAR_011905 [Mya arenaria]|uniref:Uncharacterized protein n=1 Tax=Mya arenaria TaxID=6604 RepID=A0ABY7G4I2_MYAAR|nr:hypothetical protein MAR_011905 [Mya arenaria]